MNIKNVLNSREGHRSVVYIKQENFPHLRRLISICMYFRKKGDKKRQSLSYWFSKMLIEQSQNIFDKVQDEEGIILTWKDKNLIVVERKTASQKMIDKVFKNNKRRNNNEEE